MVINMTDYEPIMKKQKENLQYYNNVADTSALYLDKARIKAIEDTGLFSEEGVLDYSKLKQTSYLDKFVDTFDKELSGYAKKILGLQSNDGNSELKNNLTDSILKKGVFGLDKIQLIEYISQSPDLVGSEFYRLQSNTKRLYSELENSLVTPYAENKDYLKNKLGETIDIDALGKAKAQELINSILKNGWNSIKSVPGIDSFIKDRDGLEDIISK